MGGFFGISRAVEESPVFKQSSEEIPKTIQPKEPLHIALVKIRDPESLDDGILRGISHTLTQLSRLGMGCCVVVDCANKGATNWRQDAITQADRVAEAIEAQDGPGARRLDDVVEVNGEASNAVDRDVRVAYRKILLAPLRAGAIPVIAPIGHTSQMVITALDADDIILALAKEFAGLTVVPNADAHPDTIAEGIKELQKEVSVDRLIILDALGGIPSTDRPMSPHVFINLEQEYETIREDMRKIKIGNETKAAKGRKKSKYAIHKTSDPLFRVIQSTAATLNESGRRGISPNLPSTVADQHLRNLELLQKTLALLPPSSSALLTTPHEAANSGRQAKTPADPSSVGTRRQRNALIHNLLTDKPAFSSSLPLGRLGSSKNNAKLASPKSLTTFVKRGMPVTILPDPKIRAWTAAAVGRQPVKLDDPSIDLPRLVALIEDSFGRKLDVEHYLRRVNDRIAGLIIAGEYEGGALLTWETPPGVQDDGSEESRSRMVPYLDKFAVLKRSQGAGGVADIVFKAMVRDCFPNGVCWRSRMDNPVNKWYFERSRGTWKLPGTNWTMFWTTEGVVEDERRFLDYEGVCRGVEPSWADRKSAAD